MMTVILDYDVGNLASVNQAFQSIGLDVVISNDPFVIASADALVLPGVGAFEDAMKALVRSGLIPLIFAHVQQNKPLLGICLGMQLLYETSEENGIFEGLGLLKGSIRYLSVPLKVPHMGWNSLTFHQPDHPLLKYIQEDDYVYFVHSYYVDGLKEQWVATTDYGVSIPAIVVQGNIYATQFHPEKSGRVGINILKAFKEVIS